MKKEVRYKFEDEVKETLSVLECCYVLRDGTPLPQPVPPEDGSTYVSEYVPISDVHSIRGTNNLPWLMEYWDLTVEWMDGKSIADFTVTDNAAPCLVRRELLEETGPEQDKAFCVVVVMEDEVIGTGKGRTKKNAEQQAAYEALLLLRERGIRK